MQVFELAPGGSGKVMWVVAVFLILTMAGTLALLFSGARRPSFEVSPEGLRVRGNLYGRFIPASQLRIAEAQVVNLNATQDLRPKWRTNGVGLPGYSIGWFRLRNREKALLFLTDRTRAVHIPTTEGYVVLISPQNPDAFVKALRSTQLGA